MPIRAKSNKPKKAKLPKKPAKKARRNVTTNMGQRGPGRVSVDSRMAECMRMLQDPCNSKPVGIYGGPAGIIQRFKSTITVNTGGTSTAGFFYWMPGNGNIWSNVEAVNNTTTVTIPGGSATNAPGNGWLSLNASSIRPLAACVKVFSTAPFNTRTGYITAGIVPSAGVAQPASSTVSSFASALGDAENVQDVHEFKWFPGDEDGTYTRPGTGVGVLNSNQNAVAIAYDSLPAGVPLRIEMTLIVEWLPLDNVGIVESAIVPTNRPVNLESVKSALYYKDPKWWMRMATTAASAYLTGGASGLVASLARMTMG